MARSVAASFDYPDARIVSVDHPISGLNERDIAARAREAVDAILAAFLEPRRSEPQ
jgi:hypothetical protein